MPEEKKKLAFGELLVQRGKITADELKTALKKQEQTGVRLGQMLVSLGFLTSKDLLEFLSEQFNIPAIDLQEEKINARVAEKLPENYARRYRTILLEEDDDKAVVAMTNPEDITATDELRRVLKKPLELRLALESDVLRTIAVIYRRTEDINKLAEELDEDLEEVTGKIQFRFAKLAIDETQVDAPVIKLVQTLFEDAVDINASDIHIEPDETVLRIRLRIDGMLYEQIMPEKAIATAIALRLKLISGLNISETRMPQDGRIKIKAHDKDVDVRVSTLPTQYGETIVMRLLDQSTGILNMRQLGMPDELLVRFRKLLKKPYGIILVTGPTGSGKSTTLYSALKEIDKEEVNIITVEDPVEYRLPRINQVQVNHKLGLDFVRVLKSILRQDPDIVMVGEMRDVETVQVALRSALTGHLVLSTLHTNDSPSSAMRLIDMGAKGFLVASTVQGILAQRLVRRICLNCKERYELSPEEKVWLDAVLKETGISLPPQFYMGKGCPYCNQSGYKGRIGIYELLELDDEMRRFLQVDEPIQFAERAREVLKGGKLLDSALSLVQQEVTTVAEAMRISGWM